MKLLAIPKIPLIPEKEKSPVVIQLLEIVQIQADVIQILRDEISRVKGQKGKPTIKPSALENTKTEEEKKKKRKGSNKKAKTSELEIHETKILEPEHIPSGSEFKGYQDFTVQDIILSNWNIAYRRARYLTPSGDYIAGQLPPGIDCHFGPTLISFVLYLHYGCHVTEPLIAETLHELGVQISTGQISNILIMNKERFHEEKGQILAQGLKFSGHLNTDDTGARHQGRNGYCTHIGNEYFAWFLSSDTKSRINFLEILRAGYMDYCLNDDALEYMATHGLPICHLAKLRAYNGVTFQSLTAWRACLSALEIKSPLHIRLATEGALVGSVIDHGFNKKTVIISDDAGQFNVFLHGLCWVHAERKIQKLVPVSARDAEILEQVRADIWRFYQDLKAYRQNPNEEDKVKLGKRFDELFSRETGFISLDQALGRILKNKSELLLVLERPDIPLHNNLSEGDIREYVKKRKISGSTRSDLGRMGRDTFISLKKTCRKLGVSFWKYLEDRLSGANTILPIAEIMAAKMAKPDG